ncbi:retinaldehyde-binding protein 1-like isoform X3 [Diabrotica virgifera virgifera]|uniref:CRAL-TRIO domain-containing protein n=1 Tax=Diabrotica virgifera virgifera TaxID=50390 RepID=A0ABM5JUD0_DIAVI|nr:retinaldehyde-binding protein 1-like isoform X3 [Diabrotica virgifera virgifera]
MILPYNFTADEVISVGRTSRTNVEAVKSSLKICNESYVPKELPDELIVEFLLACENDVEFAKTTISVHYRLKKEEPLLFDNYSGINPEIKELFDIWSISTLPTRTKENYSIHYFRLESSDLKKFNSITVLRSALMVVDITLNNNPPDGFIVIVDLNLAGLRHLTKLKYDLIKKFFCFIQEALPMRLKAIHVLNNNFIVTQFFNLIKTFVKNEVFERIHLHPSNLIIEEFYEHVAQDCLPKDLNGKLPYLKELSEITKQQFIDRQEFWNMEEKLRKKCN